MDRELIANIKSDYYRNTGEQITKKAILKVLLVPNNHRCKFLIVWRVASAYQLGLRGKLLKMIYYKYSRSFNFEIPLTATIGEGLRLPHYAGGVVLHPNVIIGKNCEIMQGVTVGNNIMKNRDTCARIGDNVILGSGCKIVGDVKIGNNVFVGANAVVTRDVPDNCIVAGVPAHIIKNDVMPVIINNDY